MDKNKVFSIKGAVDVVARELGVSRYTIYNYLDEINAGNINS
ncbi:helix-turn-helix domain-containing protein [Desulforamulus hydrothermalis]